jgi:ATP-binding cassette subfamily F protein uup
MALISCQEISKAFGGPLLLSDATLQVERGERIGLLGRNGEGKSTMLKIISGEYKPDSGELVCGSGVRVAMLSQQVEQDLPGTAGDLVNAACIHGSDTHHGERLCSLLELDARQLYRELSGGQKRRAMLARALAREPDVLLLDEPTNHLDVGSIEWLESFLMRFAGSLLFVTHDRRFLQRVATRIVELDRGRLTSWDCDYPTYLQRKEALLAAEQAEWEQFDKKLASEEVWIRQGIKARRTRNEGRVRALERLRAQREQRRERSAAAAISIQTAERSGRKVITAEKVSFGYGGEPLIRDFSTVISRGDTLGLIGSNGCGKTTLLSLLLGKLQPTNGRIEHGTRLNIAYFDQHRAHLDEDESVLFNVAGGNDFVEINGRRRHTISYLQDFLFSPDRLRQPVRSLSGGERNRLLLARLFTRSSNLLVLDEPTNDLDTETLELLEAQLLDYPGTVLLVSHDRAFLDNLCTGCFVFEGAGQISEYVGGWSDWRRVADRQARAAVKRSPVAGETPEAKGRKPVANRKLTNRERARWRALPSEIEALERELEELQQRMANATFFRREPEQVRKASQRVAALPEKIERAYEEWTKLDEIA